MRNRTHPNRGPVRSPRGREPSRCPGHRPVSSPSTILPPERPLPGITTKWPFISRNDPGSICVEFSFVSCAAFLIGYQQATSQERIPPVPSKRNHPREHHFRRAYLPHLDRLHDRTNAPSRRRLLAPSENPLQRTGLDGRRLGRRRREQPRTNIREMVEERRFLIRSFRYRSSPPNPSRDAIIAWDPAEKRIRSWTYDSHGGFGEESWTRAETAGQCEPSSPCLTGAVPRQSTS